MATAATIGKWALSIGATEIKEVISISGFGTQNSLVEVTSFSSPAGRTEFIAGLADGSEVAVDANRISDDPGQIAFIAAVQAGSTETFTLVYDATQTFTFDAVCMVEEINPSFSEQNKVSFSLKISGDIVETP